MDYLLLNSQRNEVFLAIQQFAMEPREFEWETTRSSVSTGILVSRLTHVPSASYFLFDSINGSHWCEYAPGEESRHESAFPGGWNSQLSRVDQWLYNLRREINSPDLWATIADENAMLLGVKVDGGSDNTPFSADEVYRLSTCLHEIGRHVMSTNNLTVDQLAFIEERIGYLEEASTRLGRKDWANLALGALINIIVGAALAPAAAKDLLRLASCSLAWVFSGWHIPLR